MKVILIDDIENLGKKGEIKEVASGYARNFLIPKGLVVQVGKGSIKMVEQIIQAREKKIKVAQEKSEEMKVKLEKNSFTILIKEGIRGKLFGAVTHKEIADIIYDQTGLEINKKQISEILIKEIGDHKVKIKLAEGIEAVITVKVEAKKEKNKINKDTKKQGKNK
jgi:large subunit ribosomal protein L9